MAYGTKEIKALLDKRFPGEKFKRIYKQGDIVDPNLTIRSFESKERIVCVISDFTGPTSVTAIELASPHRCTAVLKEIISSAKNSGDQDETEDELESSVIFHALRNTSELSLGGEPLDFENREIVSYDNGKFILSAGGDWQSPHRFEARIAADGYIYVIPGSMVKEDMISDGITLSVKALTTRVIPTPTPLKKEYAFQLDKRNFLLHLKDVKTLEKDKGCFVEGMLSSREIDKLLDNFCKGLSNLQGCEHTWILDEAREPIDIEELRSYLLSAGLKEIVDGK